MVQRFAIALILPVSLLGCETTQTTAETGKSLVPSTEASERFPNMPVRWEIHSIDGVDRQLYYTEEDGGSVIFWIDRDGKVRLLDTAE